jgi:anti-anti-sigma factor
MFRRKRKQQSMLVLRLPTALSGRDAIAWWEDVREDVDPSADRWVLDARDVASFDASGLAVLVRILAQCRVAGGDALLVNAPAEFLGELHMIGFDVVVPSTARPALAV